MQYQVPVRAARSRRSGGQALVESAFTFLPLLALIMGITDFGMMIFRWSTLQNAVREGCRYAVTFQVDASGHQDTSIKNNVAYYTLGFAKTTDTPATIIVKYFNPTTFAQIVTNGNKPGNIVQVSVQGVAFSWLAPLTGGFGLRTTTPLSINVYASDILGGFPTGVNNVLQ